MKKTITLLVVFAIFQLPAIAQKLYFKGQVGYDFGFFKSQMNLSSDNIVEDYDSTTITSSYQSYKNSYATGVSFSAGVGIMATKYLGVELTGFYTACNEQKFESQIRMQDVLGYNFRADSKYILKGTYFGLKPSLTFSLPGKAFRAYARIGAVLGFTKMEENMDMNVTSDSPNYLPFGGMEYTLQYKMRLAAGVNAALGVEYMILNRLWVYAELDGNFVNYSPISASYSKYIISRQDITESLTVHEREINFVDNYSDADNQSPSEPTKRLPVNYSFSSLEISIGLKYTLFD
jgi:hypothetical protein